MTNAEKEEFDEWEDIRKNQPLINIGTAGHVDHGKTTLLEALTGIWAARHSEELKRGITLKLGYAETAVFKCPKCPPPQCYYTGALAPEGKCRYCGAELEFVRRLSFVDVPGHEMLMAVMLAGATMMDGVVMVIDATMPCPQPQTREHFMALTIIGVRNIVIIQNKIDLVPKEKILENYRQIKEFFSGTWAENAPIIPVSALHKANIDVVIEAIEKRMPDPQRDPSKPPLMMIARSFDVNKPGTPPDKLQGGVIGGTIIQGKFKLGDEIEIRPGLRIMEKGKIRCQPLFTEIVGLKSSERNLKTAYPGGLIGVGTLLDPSITKSDNLMGNLAGKPGTLPPIRESMTLEVYLMERVVGTPELLKVEPIRRGEVLALNVGTAATLGTVVSSSKDNVNVKLKFPICAGDNVRVAISRRVAGRWRLIGYGLIR